MSDHTTSTTDPDIAPVPDDYPTVSPYVIARDAGRFMDFVVEVFGATERSRFVDDDGRVGHGELELGGSVILTFDADDSWPDTPAFLSLYVEDCDQVQERALAAGAHEITAVANSFYGDRGGRFRDPFGNIWWVQTRVEEVSEQEQEARLQPGSPYLDALIEHERSLRVELAARV